MFFRTPYIYIRCTGLYYLFVYLKSFKELLFLFAIVSESGCKGKRFYRNHQMFSKVFLKKFFRRFSEGVRLTLSRSLAHLQGKILGAASALSSVAPALLSLSSSAALPLESGCKGTDFFLSCNFYGTLFSKFFQGFI